MNTLPDPRLDNKTAMARQCLRLIGDIATRGARSSDPDLVGYALQELTQVLYERTGEQDSVFLPVPPDRIYDLEQLYKELDFVNCASEDLAHIHGASN